MSDFTSKPNTFCKVCGNVVPKRKEYQPSVCEACQKFFRRHCERQLFLSCSGIGGVFNKCPIDCKNRRICQSCRFSRCLAVGMNSKFLPTAAATNTASSSSSGDDQTVQSAAASVCTADSATSVDAISNSSTDVTTTMALAPFLREPELAHRCDAEAFLKTCVHAYTALHGFDLLPLKRMNYPDCNPETILQVAIQQLQAQIGLILNYGEEISGDTQTGLTGRELRVLRVTSSPHITAVFNNLLGNRGGTLFGLSDSMAPLILTLFPEIQKAMGSCVELQAELESWNPTLVEAALLMSALFFTAENSHISEAKIKRIQNRLLVAFSVHCASKYDLTTLWVRRCHFSRSCELARSAANGIMGAIGEISDREPHFASLAQILDCSEPGHL